MDHLHLFLLQGSAQLGHVIGLYVELAPYSPAPWARVNMRQATTGAERLRLGVGLMLSQSPILVVSDYTRSCLTTGRPPRQVNATLFAFIGWLHGAHKGVPAAAWFGPKSAEKKLCSALGIPAPRKSDIRSFVGGAVLIASLI